MSEIMNITDLTALAWLDDMSLWPPICFADIFQYFVLDTGLYTLEQSKRMVSLDGYNYFTNGHVQPVYVHDPGVGNMVFVKADVLPSQRQGTKTTMYKAYIVAEKSGRILTVNCTCMAGYE